MSDIEQFRFGGRQIRVIDIGGEPWWIARDICDVLELADVSRAVEGLDDDEKRQLSQNTISTRVTERGRAPWIISESGLYSLILRSRKPEAKAFRRWVTHEVLPTIRRTDGYQIPSASIQVTINAFAEAYHNEHVVSAAGSILSFKRWGKTRKGIERFHQLTLDINLPAIEGDGKRGITRGKGD